MSSLLIMEDVTASLKILDVQMMLENLVYVCWYYRMSIICLVQSYNAMPLPIQKTISHLACYKPRKKNERDLGGAHIPRQGNLGGFATVRV